MKDTFSVRDTLAVNGKQYAIASLAKLGQRFDLKRLIDEAWSYQRSEADPRRIWYPG